MVRQHHAWSDFVCVAGATCPRHGAWIPLRETAGHNHSLMVAARTVAS